MRGDTPPGNGDEGGDHAIEAEHRHHQQQLQSAVSAQHRDQSQEAPDSVTPIFPIAYCFDAANWYSLYVDRKSFESVNLQFVSLVGIQELFCTF